MNLATKHDESEKEEELARNILGGMFVEDCGKQRGGARLFSAEVIFFLLISLPGRYPKRWYIYLRYASFLCGYLGPHGMRERELVSPMIALPLVN